MSFDRIDRKILAEMTRSSRLSHVELSERVGLSTTACARRLKQLEESGVIVSYRASLDLKRLGFGMTVFARISLSSQSDEALSAFEKEIVKCPSVVGCYLLSGSADYLVTVIARDADDFEMVHKSQLTRLPGVSRIESNLALREVVKIEVPAAVLALEPADHYRKHERAS